MAAARIRMFLATAWVGSMWTIGYVVAPTLFATLTDRVLAGTIAGRLFRIEAWLTVACAIAMIASIKWSLNQQEAKPGRVLVWLVLGMLACTLIGYFGLQPFMSALRETAVGGVMDSDAQSRFGLLHGVASTFYLIQSLLGVALVWKLR